MQAPPRFADAEDLIHQAVTKKTGLTDFGPGDYLAGLRALLRSMDFDVQFSPEGRERAWGEMVTTLIARARAFEAFKRHPEARDVRIIAPIAIVGIPRTGTTVLHKLMAVDPQFQGLQTWLTNAPTPRPLRETWAQNPFFQETVARLERLYAANPAGRAAHHIVADEVDECLEILRQTFVSNRWACMWPAASYDSWWQTQNETFAYHYLRQMLGLIGAHAPKTRWLLKNPGHIANLDKLFAVFPDALVIQTHRDPAQAIPSLCGLLMKAHTTFEHGRVRERAYVMGLRETEKWAKAVADAKPVREAHRKQIIDIDHRELHAKPLTVIARIYDAFGLRLTQETEAAMAARLDKAPESKHGAHVYDIADFGLTREDINGRFTAYNEEFGLLEPGPGRARAKL